ncbi:hypothetical protein TW65_02126 [Stemphylium lycopersici]|nr:hypothetical protein TW65_02126 [Stemphylium lycopersici]
MYSDLNESTLLTLPSSTSTLRISALVEATEWKEASAKHSSASDTARLREHSISFKDRASISLSEGIESVPSALGSRSAIPVEEDGLPDMGLSDQPATQLSARYRPRTTRYIVTISGIADIVTAREPQFQAAGALEIHIEYTVETTALGTNRNGLEIVYGIEWLSVEKARELLEEKATTVVDVEALQFQTSHVLDRHNDILIMARGAFVRITPRQ